MTSYDYLLINSSAGKDSQAMLTHVVGLVDAAGVSRDRIVVVHADLGRVEWPGTCELAAQQAAAYGLRFEVVSRSEDLLDQVVARRRKLDALADTLWQEGKALLAAGLARFATIAHNDSIKRTETPAWPSSTARYCTSDQKTSQVAKLMTRLVREHQDQHGPAPVRILNCLGIRAEESPARAKKQPFHVDPATNGKRHVDRWLPIFDWSTERVWDVVRASGLPWHPAYDAVPRLSCVLCVLSGRRELVLAARLNPGLAAEYVEIESRIGHRFRSDVSMADIVAEAGATVPLGTVSR